MKQRNASKLTTRHKSQANNFIGRRMMKPGTQSKNRASINSYFAQLSQDKPKIKSKTCYGTFGHQNIELKSESISKKRLSKYIKTCGIPVEMEFPSHVKKSVNPSRGSTSNQSHRHHAAIDKMSNSVFRMSIRESMHRNQNVI